MPKVIYLIKIEVFGQFFSVFSFQFINISRFFFEYYRYHSHINYIYDAAGLHI